MSEAVVLQHEAAQPGAGGGGVEPEQRLTVLDEVAFLDEHLAQDAAFQMLDVLVLSRGDERAGDHDRAVQRGDRAPSAEAADAQQQDGGANDRSGYAHAGRHVLVPFVHALDSAVIRAALLQTLPQAATAAGAGNGRLAGSALSRRRRTSLRRAERFDPAGAQDQHLVDDVEQRGPLGDDDGGDAASAWRAPCVSVSACSPAASRLELGSSSTTMAGSPKKARASAMRCFWPPDSGAPLRSSTVS